GMLLLDVLLDVGDELILALAAHGLATWAVDLHGHAVLLSWIRRRDPTQRCWKQGPFQLQRQLRQRLPRGLLLGRLLRGPFPHARLLTVDHRGAGERTVMRRAFDLENGVRHRAATASN